MNKMKQFLNLVAIMMVTMILCVACGEKNVVKTVEKMYAEGIERLQKAKNYEDTQNIYDEVFIQVKKYQTEHLEEFASLDSTANTLQKTKESFLKACCYSLLINEGKGCVLRTENGFACIGKDGNVEYPKDDEGEEWEENNSNANNPLGLTGLTPVYEQDSYEDGNGKHYFWYCKYITVQNSKGDYLYSDEDAERYYEGYLNLFFMAKLIAGKCDKDENMREYMKNNLSNIVTHLPLDESYPENIRERVNKIYYDWKDEMSTLHISERGYGYLKCAYYINGDQYNQHSFYLRRDKDNGRLRF